MNNYATFCAFYGDPAIKAKHSARLHARQTADKTVQDAFAEPKGYIAAYCPSPAKVFDPERDKDYGKYGEWALLFGYPTPLSGLRDAICEGLPESEARQFALDFLAVVPVGADLRRVWPRFALWLLSDAAHGVLQFVNAQNGATAQSVVDFYRVDSAERSGGKDDNLVVASYSMYAAAGVGANALRCIFLAAGAACRNLQGPSFEMGVEFEVEAAACAVKAFVAAAESAGLDSEKARLTQFRAQAEKLIDLLSSEEETPQEVTSPIA